MPAVVSISYVHYLINRNDNNLFRLGKIKELGWYENGVVLFCNRINLPSVLRLSWLANPQYVSFYPVEIF